MEQQGANSQHIDHYMQGQGLGGQGLCARALYDYQAGECPATGPRVGNKSSWDSQDQHQGPG